MTGSSAVRMRTWCLAALLGGVLPTAPLPAQDTTIAAPVERGPWRTNYFPYLLGNPTTGLMLVGHIDYFRQADYFARVPHDAIFTVDGTISAQGSRSLIGRLRAPLLVPRWRFAVDAGASRESRFGYFGYSPAEAAPDDHSDRVHRTRYFVRAEVTRQIAGPLSVAAMLGVERTNWSRLPGATAFGLDFGDEIGQTDAGGRVTLVLDTRDREFLVNKGVFAEAGLLFGGGGEHRDLDVVSSGSYGGWYANLRGYVSPRQGTIVAGRLAARSLSEEATLQARNTLPGWESGVDALGGPYAHRSFTPGRVAGRGLLLGSFEVRHNLLDVGDYGAVTLIGFVDGGRVFAEEDFSLTTTGWKVGGGGGVALRVLRTSLLVFNFAGGPAGFTFSMGTGWAF
jgi:outer membrane protein assembly factor BamA